MKTIALTQGKVATVDDWNFEWLNRVNWRAFRDSKNGRWYAMRTTSANGAKSTQLMHRVIAGNPAGLEIDHKNGNGLLNTEENLRVATTSQNQCNAGLRKDNTSGFKGVTRHHRKWQSKITFSGNRLHLGYFDTAIEAAAVYNFVAKRLFGEFAVLNDLSQVTEEQLL
jgi:hypothetical protein